MDPPVRIVCFPQFSKSEACRGSIYSGIPTPTKMTSFLTSGKALKGLAVSAALGAATLAIPGAAQAAIIQVNFQQATWGAPTTTATSNYLLNNGTPVQGTITGSYYIDTVTKALSNVNVTFSKFYVGNTTQNSQTFTSGLIKAPSAATASASYVFSNATKSVNLILNNTQLTATGGFVTWGNTNSQMCQSTNGTSNCNRAFTGVGGLGSNNVSVPFPAPLLGVAPFALMALRKRNPFAKAKQAVQLATAAV